MKTIKMTYLKKLTFYLFFYVGILSYGQDQKLSFNSFSITPEVFLGGI